MDLLLWPWTEEPVKCLACQRGAETSEGRTPKSCRQAALNFILWLQGRHPLGVPARHPQLRSIHPDSEQPPARDLQEERQQVPTSRTFPSIWTMQVHTPLSRPGPSSFSPRPKWWNILLTRPTWHRRTFGSLQDLKNLWEVIGFSLWPIFNKLLTRRLETLRPLSLNSAFKETGPRDGHGVSTRKACILKDFSEESTFSQCRLCLVSALLLLCVSN